MATEAIGTYRWTAVAGPCPSITISLSTHRWTRRELTQSKGSVKSVGHPNADIRLWPWVSGASFHITPQDKLTNETKDQSDTRIAFSLFCERWVSFRS
jgi:hypothetical protein